jgi:hypothetical protein
MSAACFNIAQKEKVRSEAIHEKRLSQVKKTMQEQAERQVQQAYSTTNTPLNHSSTAALDEPISSTEQSEAGDKERKRQPGRVLKFLQKMVLTEQTATKDKTLKDNANNNNNDMHNDNSKHISSPSLETSATPSPSPSVTSISMSGTPSALPSSNAPSTVGNTMDPALLSTSLVELEADHLPLIVFEGFTPENK